MVTKSLYSLIEEINKSGMTVIMVSHDMEAAVEYASHILHIGHKPLFFGKNAEWFFDEYQGFGTGRAAD